LQNINFTKNQIATAIAIFFHAIGLIGILFFKHPFFINATPLNLLLSFALLIYTQPQKKFSFYSFVAIVIVVGIAVEVIGVNTGLLFGQYKYGKVLGIQLYHVPLIIGVNWFIVMYCCGISISTLLQKMISKLPNEMATAKPKYMQAISIIFDSATLAVFLDWLMEPVAVKLGYWQWLTPKIPMYNYICWFVVSIILLTVFHFCNFAKQNKFAIHLLMIQAMFFLLLRSFL
jgi:bisanhydrobacterioruberin hydratase